MKKTDLMLRRMIFESKAQFAAVVAVIAVGIAVFTAIALSGISLETSIDEYYDDCALADLSITVDRIPASAIADMKAVSGIAEAEGRICLEIPFISPEDDSERVNVKFLSLPTGGASINKIAIQEGREIKNPSSEAIVFTKFAYARGIDIGDTIDLQVNGILCSLKVVGIAMGPEFIYLMETGQTMMSPDEKYGVVYADESFVMQVSGMAGSYNEVHFLYEEAVMTGNGAKTALKEKIEDMSRSYGLMSIAEKDEKIAYIYVDEEVKQLQKAGVALPILFLLVAALVIAMMLERMVKRDRIKIGVMKAMGYSNKTIMIHYVKYSLAAGAVGSFFGIAVGFVIGDWMTEIYTNFFEVPHPEMRIYPSYMVWGIILASAFCVGAGLYGTRGVLKIMPAASMQPEPPKAGKHIYLENFKNFWGSLKFSRKLMFKNIFRNKKRSIFILLGVALTYGLILFTMSMPDVIDEVLIEQFEEVQTMDFNVSFHRPVPLRDIIDLEYELDETTYIEGRLEQPFEISVGNRAKPVSVVGLIENSEVMYLFDSSGKKIYPRPGHVLLTENLARSLGVKAGDRVHFQSYMPGAKDCYMYVQGAVEQTLGMNAYLRLEDMGREFFEPGVVNGVYINTSDPDVISVLRTVRNVGTIYSSKEMADAYLIYMGLMMLALGVMVFMAGVLGFAVVYNATIVSLSEREMEFSSLRVLGFSKGEIFRMTFAENALLSFVGMIFGIPIGRSMLSYSSRVFSTDLFTIIMRPSLPAGLWALFYTVMFVAVAQVATYSKIHNLDFLQALKNRAS